MKKILAILLACTLLMSISVPVFANEDTTDNVSEMKEYLVSINQKYDREFFIPNQFSRSGLSTYAPMKDIVTMEKIMNASPEELAQVKRELLASAKEIDDSSYEESSGVISTRASNLYVKRKTAIKGGAMHFDGWIEKKNGIYYWDRANLDTYTSFKDTGNYQFYCYRKNVGGDAEDKQVWVCTHPRLVRYLAPDSVGEIVEAKHTGQLYTKTALGWWPEEYSQTARNNARP